MSSGNTSNTDKKSQFNRLLVIPARGGSKRIPKKNIKNFLGVPAVLTVLDQAQKANIFDRIHVSTEDAEIQQIVSEAGHAPDFWRDVSLAGDDTPVADVVEFVVKEYLRRGEQFKTIVLAFPTAFMTDASIFRAAVEKFDTLPKSSQLISVARFPVPIDWAYDIDDAGELVPRFPSLLTVRSQDLATPVYETGQFVIYDERSVFRHNGDIKKFGFDAGVLAVDIDDERDWQLAEKLLSCR